MPPNYAVRPSRYELPPVVGGYVIDPGVGQFSVILPLGADKTNLVSNPSVETDTTGYSVNLGGAIARDSTVQKFGVYSLKCTPSASSTDGWKYDTVSLVSGTQYVASVWFKGKTNLKYRFEIFTTGGIGLVATQFIATGYWQRVSVVYLETATTTRRVYVRKDSQSNVDPFWIDGLQVEADGLTTYIDGDRTGFVRNRADYYWTGTPHASTSVRIGQSRSGGKVISLNELGFRLLSIIGLGMGGIVNQLTPLARGGAYYGGTVIADRQFSLVGQVDDSSGYLQLARKRQALIDLFKPDIVSPVQPVTLRYTPTDDCGNQQGNEQEIVCLYQDGMSGRTDNLNAERLALQFQLYLPFVMQEVGNAGASLGYQASVSTAYAATRSPSGQWAALGSGMNGIVYAVAVDPVSGRVYYGGAFTTGNGVTLNRIGYWNGTTFVAMDGGVNSDVRAITIAANGDVWIGGAFTTVGSGAAAAKGLARWNYATNTWTDFNNSTGTFSAIFALDIDYSGNLYIGGIFTNWDGTAASDYIAKYNGSAWSALGTGMNGAVLGLLATSNGYLYVAGGFSTGNGVTLDNIGYWNGTTFVSMGGMTPAGVGNSLAIGPDGSIYVVGTFSTIGGISAINIARWNGNAWFALGSGLSGGGNNVHSVIVLPNGILLAGGYFTLVGDISSNNQVAQWNGSAWSLLDTSFPATTAMYGIAVSNDGTLYIGTDSTGTATVATQTTITNTGSATAGPRVKLTGPGTVYQLTNYTTGKTIYFNLTLNAGEKAVLDLSSPSNITFVSTFRGNLLSTILAGSQLSDFALAPGANIISLFIAGTVTAATAADAQWRITTHSIDSAIPGRLLP